MRVLLVDGDISLDRSRLVRKGLRKESPNTALMRISTYHKDRGDVVGWDVDDPDKIYISAVFDWNRNKVLGLERTFQAIYPRAEIDVGGSGMSLTKTLPREMDRLMPDYSLYPDIDYSVGSTTRGCIRRCEFCIVREKEGAFAVVQHPEEFHNTAFKNIVFQDNNILASKPWFHKVCEWVAENNLKVDFNQALDARLFDEGVAETLAELRPINSWRIAYDGLEYGDDVLRTINLMRDAGIHTRNSVLVYVYCDGDHDFDSTLKRCEDIKKWGGGLPYPMFNRNAKKTPRMTRLKSWARPQRFFSFDFDEMRGGESEKPTIKTL